MIEIYCLLLGHDVGRSFKQRIVERGADSFILIFYFRSNVELSEKKSKLIFYRSTSVPFQTLLPEAEENKYFICIGWSYARLMFFEVLSVWMDMALHITSSITATLCCMGFFSLSTETKINCPWLYKNLILWRQKKCCVLLLKDWDLATSETAS